MIIVITNCCSATFKETPETQGVHVVGNYVFHKDKMTKAKLQDGWEVRAFSGTSYLSQQFEGIVSQAWMRPRCLAPKGNCPGIMYATAAILSKRFGLFWLHK